MGSSKCPAATHSLRPLNDLFGPKALYNVVAITISYSFFPFSLFSCSVINNEIPYSRCGNKYLVDIETLPQILFNTEQLNKEKGKNEYEIN